VVAYDRISSSVGLFGETLFAGLVDGRNIWADDLAISVAVIEEFRQALGKGKVFIAPFL
jgi:5-methyltetrahydropteroyltriglutamate--homocysteine methyltransferase